jgi:hypothetical protein
MKKLTKSMIRSRDEIAAAIREAQNGLEKAVDAYNETIQKQKEIVEAALEKLNDNIADAETWREQVAADQEDYVANQSERWEESDAGQAYKSWQNDFTITFEAVSIDFPEKVEMPEGDAADNLEWLAEEVP